MPKLKKKVEFSASRYWSFHFAVIGASRVGEKIVSIIKTIKAPMNQ
jgi:hypothetical protein